YRLKLPTAEPNLQGHVSPPEQLVGLLQAHYFNLKGVFKTGFPDRPQTPFNYAGAPPTANLGTSTGTRLSKSCWNFERPSVPARREATKALGQRPAKYNLVDPIERNTVGVPTGGWTAIRFRADNPGWGLKTAFVVEDGPGSDQSVLPASKDLMPC
ncbi:laccase 11, partial [Prunus dulcis]